MCESCSSSTSMLLLFVVSVFLCVVYIVCRCTYSSSVYPFWLVFLLSMRFWFLRIGTCLLFCFSLLHNALLLLVQASASAFHITRNACRIIMIVFRFFFIGRLSFFKSFLDFLKLVPKEFQCNLQKFIENFKQLHCTHTQTHNGEERMKTDIYCNL